MAEFKYLLETSTCIELLRGNERVRLKHFNRIEGIKTEDWTL